MVIMLASFAVCIIVIVLSPHNSIINNQYTARFMTICLFLYTTIMIWISDNTNIDMMRYVREFTTYGEVSAFEAFRMSDREPLFVLFQWIVARTSSDPRVFYVSIWVLFSILLIYALKRIFTSQQIMIVYFCYLNYFIVMNYITNTVRQGFAIALLIVAVCILLRHPQKHAKKFYLAIIAASLFHVSSLPLSIILWLIKKYQFKLKTIIVIWCGSAFLLVTNLNQYLFGWLQNYSSYIDVYSSVEIISKYGSTTNRLDFLLFSSFWLILAFLLWKYKAYKDKSFETLIKVYALFNSYYLMLGFVAYSDRLASYSWFLIPILMLYPVVSMKKDKRLFIFAVMSVFVLTALFTSSLLYYK